MSVANSQKESCCSFKIFFLFLVLSCACFKVLSMPSVKCIMSFIRVLKNGISLNTLNRVNFASWSNYKISRQCYNRLNYRDKVVPNNSRAPILFSSHIYTQKKIYQKFQLTTIKRSPLWSILFSMIIQNLCQFDLLKKYYTCWIESFCNIPSLQEFFFK